MAAEQTPQALLQILQTAGIKLWVETGDRLKASAPDGALTPALREQIGAHKAALVTLLQQLQGAQHDAIVPAARTEPLPLSFAQQRLWFLDQMAGARTAYNIPLAFRLEGVLQPQALHQSLAAIMQRHESLRTTFALQAEQPVQIIQPVGALPWTQRTLVDVADVETALHAVMLAEAEQPFDLAQGPLWRITLIELDATTHILLITIHHIVADGWSVGVLLQELAALYPAYLRGAPPALPPLPIQYADFAQWQRQTLQGERLAQQLAFWETHLAGAPALLELPTDYPRPPQLSYRGHYQIAELPADLVNKIKALSGATQTTLFMTLYAAFVTLLYRLSQQSDIIVGTPVANRPRSELEPLIGFFVNLLPLRTTLHEDLTFRQLLTQVRETVSRAYGAQAVPFESLVERLRPTRDASYAPIMQVDFVVQERLAELHLPDLLVTPLDPAVISAKFDLGVELMATATGAMRAFWTYNLDLFAAETIQRMMRHFETLLTSIVADPDQSISRLRLLTAAERHHLLCDWQEPQRLYPVDTTIHQRFAAQVERHPDRIALVFHDSARTPSPDKADMGREDRLTYRQLNARANQLAHYLIQQGVGPETLVGICVERSLELVIGLLGILKAGGAYVPLDPGYPEERLAFTLADAGITLLLTQAHLQERLPTTTAQQICLDRDWPQIAQHATTTPAVIMQPDNLAYVIYTSGSTGMPKGVMVQHNQVIRLFTATEAWFHFNEHDVWTLFHSFAFDFSVWEIWGALLYGGRLVVVSYWDSRSPERFYQLLAEQGVTVLNQTPSAFRQLIRVDEFMAAAYPLQLRYVIFGGEALELAALRPWFARHGDQAPQLINMYGITETTVHVTYRPLTQADASQSASLIGGPIPDLQLYVLDAQQQPTPLGVTGELYVGGAGVARGYLNRPTLTAERFVQLPALGSASEKQRLYRTGDLVRRRADGDIQYIGRIDNQVKIRGFRIELGEIEALLNQHPQVREAVVLVRTTKPCDENRTENRTENHDEKAEQQLVAYLVPTLDTAARDGAVADAKRALAQSYRDYLQSKVPDYMVPAAFVLVDAMPLTANGKLDRKALLASTAELATLNAPYVAPTTATEQAIAAMYHELLDVPTIGRHDDFFALGGHSLLGMRLITRIRQQWNLDLAVRTIFEQPTIAQLATTIDLARLAAAPTPAAAKAPLPLRALPRTETAPLSFAQRRLWFLAQLEPMSPFYNIPATIELTGTLHVTALEESFRYLIGRHESLRTTFVTPAGAEAGEPVQVVAPPAAASAHFALPLLAVADATAAHQRAQIEATTPFNLQAGPLLRAHLYKTGAESHLLSLTMHHIISDGWSTGILLKELAHAYRAYTQGEQPTLPALPVQYADFAIWQRQSLTGAILDEQLAYWRSQLAGAPTLLELPTDRPRPPVQSFRGAHYEFHLAADLTAKLQQLAHRHEATLFMVLLAAFNVLLARYSRQTDIVVGTPIANRNRTEIEGLLGFFVNTLALRTQLDDNPAFSELLARVRQSTLAAYDHQELPFERLVDELGLTRTLSYSPLFQVGLVLQNAGMGDFVLPDVTATMQTTEFPFAKFDLMLNLAEGEVVDGAGLTGLLEYATDLFDQATIARMVEHFTHLLASIVAQPAQPVFQLPLLPAAEYNQLVYGWNATAVAWPSTQCVPELVAAQAAAQPAATALLFGDQRMSYGELNARANQLAHHLQTLGVGAETMVGVCLERSLDLVVSILAVLKAGGAYLPLDPSYPPERLRFMLADAQVTVLLTQAALVEHLVGTEPAPGASPHCFCVDRQWATIAPLPTTNPAPTATLDSLAYTIYTSGSTGQPKGVLIPHRGLCNLVAWHQRAFAITTADHATVLAGLGFDAAVWEVWPYLTAGATLHLIDPTTLGSAEHLRDWLVAQAITVTFLPTPLAEQVLPLPWPATTALRFMLTGGDRLRSYPAPDLPFALVNNYGPTENSVVTTAGLVVNHGRPTPAIGRPIDNVQLYVLDPYLQPTPIGVPGELHIGGSSLARGYLRRPALTAEKFIDNPFPAPTGRGHLYKTGDLVRYLPTGELEFLGRTDSQVKIRGFRIELGEIESALLGYSGVREAAVVAYEETPQDKRLVAYLVSDGPLDSAHLRHYLAQYLPAYMVPAAFVPLAALPLTPNGKVDRRALPVPERYPLAASEHYVAPGTPTEIALARIWADLLGVAQVGVDDNFFAIGGDSILSLQIVGRAKQQGIHLVTKDLFQHQTIRELAAVARVGTQNQAEQGVVTGELPLTPIQQWFLAQDWRESHHFNQALLLTVAPTVNPTWLASALTALLHHHDALRLRFQPKAERAASGQAPSQQWQQVNQGIAEAVALELVDLSMLAGPARQAHLAAVANRTQASLHLSDGPLLRAVLFTCGEQESKRLLLVIHHLAVDGVSWRILLEDLQSAYQQCRQGQPIKLPAKTTAFRDWARWLADQGVKQVEAERAWWAQVVHDAAAHTPVDLPTDFPQQGGAEQGKFAPSQNSFASADQVLCTLSAAETDALLHQAPAAYHTQVNDLLLTALARTMSKWLDAPSISLELEGHGREFSEVAENAAMTIDLSRTVGWFTTMFPVILHCDQPETGALIKSIKEQLRRIPNRGIGYGILRYLGQRAELTPPNPIALSFNYLGQFATGKPSADEQNSPAATEWLLNFAPESSGEAQSAEGQRPHLLAITGQVIEGQLQVSWQYSRNFHQPTTIAALAETYMTHLRAIIAHCLNPVAGGFTPSDFSALTIEQTELDQLVADIGLALAE